MTLCDRCINYPCSNNDIKLLKYCPAFNPKEKPTTNADRIRSMTDEELADAFAMISDCMSCNCRNAEDDCSIVDGTCQQQWLKWLQQEV